MSFTRQIGLMAVAMVLVTGCGGDDDSLEGTYRHEEEGTIEVLADGEATITQSGDPVELTYEVDGDTVTFDADGESVKAEITDEGLVFEDEAFSGEGTTTFSKEE